MSDEKSGSLISIIKRWKTALMVVSAAGLITSLVFSLPWAITPRYKSTVIMYPVSTSSLASSMMNDLMWSDEDLLEFGEREQADQLKQVLESNQIRDRLILHFHLKEHYNIDTSASFPETRLWKEYERNVDIRINEYGAVELSIYDTDPQQAADMANRMAALLDSTIHGMQQVRADKAVEITLMAYNEELSYIHKLEDSLSHIRALGVNDYESQAQVTYEELAIQLGKGNTSAVQALEEKLSNLGVYGGPYISIKEELVLEKEHLSELKVKFEKARMDALQDLPEKFIVNDAYRAEIKAYPQQWVIVAGTGISTFLFALLILIAYDQFQRVVRNIRNPEDNT